MALKRRPHSSASPVRGWQAPQRSRPYALTVVDIVINIRLVVQVKAVEVPTVVTVVKVVVALVITLPVDMALIATVKVVLALDTTVNVDGVLLFSPDNEAVDERWVLEMGIIPRVVIRATSALVQEVFEVEQTHFVSMAQRAQSSAKVIRPGQDKATRDLYRNRLKEEHKLVMATGARSWVQGMARQAQEPASGRRGRPNFKLAVAAAERAPRTVVTSTRLASAFDKSQVPWERVLVPFSFGRAPQLVKLILNLHDHVLPRPSRSCSRFGCERTRCALGRPRPRRVSDRGHLGLLGSGYGELSATLSILLDLDVYSAGFAPFLRYKFPLSGGVTAVSLLSAVFQSSSQHGNHDQQPVETPTRLVGRTVAFEDEEPIELVSCSTSDSNSVLGPCTTVFRLTRPSLHAFEGEIGSRSFVLQMQHVTPNFVGGEAEMLRSINHAHDSGVLPSETVNHVAMLEVATSLRQHRSQVNDHLLPRRKATGIHGYDRDNMLRIKAIRRPLDLLILRNPTPVPRILASGPGMSLDSPAPLEHVLQVFDQLLTVLGHVVLSGWGGGVAARPGEVVPAGKIDEDGGLWMTRWTAPLNVLRWSLLVPGDDLPNYDLSHALESSVYWFLLVLGQLIAPAGEAIWSEMFFQPDPARDRDLTRFSQRRTLCGPESRILHPGSEISSSLRSVTHFLHSRTWSNNDATVAQARCASNQDRDGECSGPTPSPKASARG
ncbi:BQ5605_C010g06128 [Microbotryum silenes-dioicae]|uniref:BQ5605_C010g06128 protein n=1 Tax=Microbotryum silenes-dioicae TaxID=796604 RepID=A0A2X0LTX9_9BASI|nr:BQ5605_C010g06128 [Microbotryum silenes-dioicae]